MNIIFLVRRDGMWACQFAGPHASRVRRLFGCDCLPTPYRDTEAARFVSMRIGILNPGVEVICPEAVESPVGL